jgi:hypothetical protein
MLLGSVVATILSAFVLLCFVQGNRQVKYLGEVRDLTHLRHERERREESVYIRKYAEEYALACIASVGRNGWQEVGDLLSFIPQDDGFFHPNTNPYPLFHLLPVGTSQKLYAVRTNFHGQSYAFFVDCGDAGVRIIPTDDGVAVPVNGAIALVDGEQWSLAEIAESLVAMDALGGAA